MRRDAELDRLAASQDWVVGYGQLAELGWTRKSIEHAARTGVLYRRHHGVYAVGRAEISERGRRIAATLACGPNAVLSHRSAAALWRLLTPEEHRIDVTVPGGGRQRQPGIWIRRTRVLTPDDVAAVDGIPVTSVARTIVDLASLLDYRSVLDAIEQADRLKLLDLTAVHHALQRVRGRRRLGKLKHILGTYKGAPDVRSGLERRFLRITDKAGLPRPETNVLLHGFLVDVYWPQWRLVVEIDGYDYHASPRQFELDRIRDTRLQRERIRVMRVTAERLDNEPRAILDDVLALAATA